MKTSTETIPPETARRWLELNLNNRTLSDAWVRDLARMMKAGLWRQNAEAIKFSVSGKLIDGQHRLAAVVMSGVTIQALVARGLEEDAALSDDRKIRTIADVFQLQLQNHTRIYARAIQAIFKVRNLMRGTSTSQRLSAPEALEFYSSNERSLTRSMEFVGFGEKVIVSREMLVAWHFLFSASKNAQAADDFISQLKTGLNLSDQSPIWLLRKQIIEDVMATRKMRHIYKCAITIKAFNAFASKTTVKNLRWTRSTEAFPVIN